MQHDFQCIFCIVDLHAVTVPQDPAELRHSTREVTAAYIAASIDPESCIIFNRAWSARMPNSLAARLPDADRLAQPMTQFKEKPVGTATWPGWALRLPVLMAADILGYKATHVPVGEDQKQHLELARDIAGAFNRRMSATSFRCPSRRSSARPRGS